jgi:glycerophosphoryl diester phosphodiesterase
MSPDPFQKVQVVAHRGASGYAPETTLESYRLALKMNVDYVEMDIHMLRDGTLVAIHDPDVKRTTDGKGQISELTLTALKTFDAGSWFNRAHPRKARPEFIGLRVPTLQEIFDLIRQSSVGCYIEIKDPDRYPPELESSLLSLLQKNRMEKRSQIISFSAQSIAKVKALDSSIQTGLLISRRRKDPVGDALAVFADELAIRHGIADASVVDAAHEKGLSVSVWTVDLESDMKRMIAIGVDRIITNYPDRLPGAPASRRLFSS